MEKKKAADYTHSFIDSVIPRSIIHLLIHLHRTSLWTGNMLILYSLNREVTPRVKKFSKHSWNYRKQKKKEKEIKI